MFLPFAIPVKMALLFLFRVRTIMENLENSWNLKHGYFQAWKSLWEKNSDIFGDKS